MYMVNLNKAGNGVSIIVGYIWWHRYNTRHTNKYNILTTNWQAHKARHNNSIHLIPMCRIKVIYNNTTTQGNNNNTNKIIIIIRRRK